MAATNQIDALLQRIESSRNKALAFFDNLKQEDTGYKYTVNHDVAKYPAAVLYGTWAVALGKSLILGNLWDDFQEKEFIKKNLLKFKQSDGSFFPSELYKQKLPKSYEYLKLHCTNYAMGAMLEIYPEYDFESTYLNRFLEADYLERWLDQRAFIRPWEESNNIVNVASYLALVNNHGNSNGKERLYQMLEWHNKYQNPKTGGFDNFSRSRKNILQSMAGAVHNFHIHHYLGEKMNYESIISKNVNPFLFEGPLTACLSIDFTELACLTYNYSEDKKELESALLYHLQQLLNYQNPDGGWYENESKNKPTTANGMKEIRASSNSYATWFRLCSIGMISCMLLGDDPDNWHFRKTPGMGYVSKLPVSSVIANPIPNLKYIIKHKINNVPTGIKNFAIQTAVKLLQ